MDQEKLEAKVEDILSREGFEIKNGIAKKPEVELEIGIYSSDKYTEEEVDLSKDKVFVDEDLEIEQAYTVEEEKRFDMPSFEIIGDIAIINDLSEKKEEDVVNAILAHHDVKTILLKTGKLSGEFRVGDYKKLYGEETETTHKEFGLKYRVDPTKVYFSERFGTERKRVAEQIDQGEDILVIGAGVGPFPILAVDRKDVEAKAIEMNPEAYHYLKINAEENHVEDQIELANKNGFEMFSSLEDKFDRIIVPIPHLDDKRLIKEFLKYAFESMRYLKKIYWYCFSENSEMVVNCAENIGFRPKIIECGQRGPNSKRLCIELTHDSINK